MFVEGSPQLWRIGGVQRALEGFSDEYLGREDKSG
jgi:hypothetical protein